MPTTGEPEAEEPQEEQRQERLRVLDLSAVGLAFPISLLLGYFAGRAIGGWLGSAQLGGLIGALVGIVGGFYNLFKMVSRLAPRRSGSIAPPPASVESRTAEDADLDDGDAESADPVEEEEP